MAGFIPWRDLWFDSALQLVRRLGPVRALMDLGCGVGSVSARALADDPSCAVTALDRDPVMTSLARQHLGSRVVVLERDIGAIGWGKTVGTPFDVVLSSSVLHILDATAYGAVTVEVATALRPGGVFVDIDEMPLTDGPLANATAALRQEAAEAHFAAGHEDFRAWYDALSAHPAMQGLAEPRTTPSGEVRVARADERIAALRQAGFGATDVVERRGDIAMIVAVLGA